MLNKVYEIFYFMKILDTVRLLQYDISCAPVLMELVYISYS